jgi:hypothetical protein
MPNPYLYPDEPTHHPVRIPAEVAPVPTFIAPIGAVVTTTGLTFSLSPVNLTAISMRLHCTACPWQAAATGPDAIRDEVNRHALAHDVDPRPRIPHLPSWLTSLPWLKGHG